MCRCRQGQISNLLINVKYRVKYIPTSLDFLRGPQTQTPTSEICRDIQKSVDHYKATYLQQKSAQLYKSPYTNIYNGRWISRDVYRFRLTYSALVSRPCKCSKSSTEIPRRLKRFADLRRCLDLSRCTQINPEDSSRAS